MSSKLVNMDDVELIHKKNVSELIELLNILNAEVLTKTHEISKDLKDSGTQITVSKEELSSKLEILDKYFIKIDTIQKQIFGDTSIDSQYKDMLKKITSHFEDVMLAIDKKVNDEVTKISDGIKIVENLKQEHLDSISTEKTKLLNVEKRLIGKTNADGLNQVVLQLETAVNKVNITLSDAKTTNNELIAVRKSGIYPYFAGVISGWITFGIVLFLLKSTFF